MRPKNNYFMQVVMYVVCILASIVPLPAFFISFRPCFFLLVMYYWSTQSVKMLPIMGVWFLGLLFDLVTGTLLGQHALVLVVVAFALEEMQPRIRLYSFWQHALLIFFLSTFYVLLQSWFMVNIAHIIGSISDYYSVFGTMIVWFGIYLHIAHRKAHLI